MRKVFNLQRTVASMAGILASAVLFTACLKDKDGDVNIPAAGLMAFNLAPDQQSVVVRLSGNTLTHTPLGYTSYTGWYQNVYTGERSVESFDYPDTAPLASSSFNFEQDKYYSMFLVGSDDQYRHVIAHDQFDSLSATSGNAYIRYINGITDTVNAPQVTIAKNGSNVVSENAAFASISDFQAVAPGEISVTVNGATGIDATRNITVEERKVYTILLTGVPGETDTDKKVQIRFVQNATLSEEESNQ